VQQLSDGGRGSLLLDHLDALLVHRQLAQHAHRDALDVLDLVKQELHEDRDHHLLADQSPVERFPRQNVERANRALDDLLHADPVGVHARGVHPGTRHRRPPLGVLERAHQQPPQLVDGAVLPERQVVGGVQRQVAHQADHGLDEGPARRRTHQFHDCFDAEVYADRVLGELRVRVPGSQVSQGADLQKKGKISFTRNAMTCFSFAVDDYLGGIR